MKTAAELKFDNIIRGGFYEVLKPLNFKKKGNNFYLRLGTFGQIINVQKSAYGTKDRISFTINTGIFIPEIWLATQNFRNNGIPDFPTEPECFVRRRIGKIRNQADTWYDIDEGTNEMQLIVEMRKNLADFILPYFQKLSSTTKVLEAMDKDELGLPHLDRLIAYGEFGMFEKAKIEYQILLNSRFSPDFFSVLKDHGRKYGLVD